MRWESGPMAVSGARPDRVFSPVTMPPFRASRFSMSRNVRGPIRVVAAIEAEGGQPAG